MGDHSDEELEALRLRIAQLEETLASYAAEREQLRKSERMLRLVMDTIPQRIFWKDRDYRFLGCNGSLLHDGGYERLDEVVGKTDFELSWRESAHIYRADDIAVVEHGVSKINYEEPQVHQDGRRLWLRTTKVPLRDEDGRVIGMFGCYEDVTERHETLRALRESEARFRTLFEQAQDGIFVADRRGNITSVNSAGRELLGYDESELCRMHVRDLIDPSDLAERPLRFDALAQGERFLTQRALRRKDGSVVPTETNVTVLPDGSLEAIVRDIRERLRAEEERRSLLEDLLHAQKMESIGRLAGGVAHDFNNLLLVILANAQLLRRKLGQGDQAELDGIVTAGERASTLTRQLLSFSRRRVLEPVVLDVSDVVHTMQPMLDRMLGDEIRLEVQLSPVPCWVLADAGQIEQVILNLAVNARDAMAGGGTLKIETIAPSQTQPKVVLRVQDDGTGMDAETRKRIFDPFFTTKGPGEGTGLGLSMVYGVVTQSGGTIHVDSEVGRGTTIALSFPATSFDEEPTRNLTRPREDAGPKSRVILLVEDEKGVRVTLERTLVEAGYQVIVASDGDEALREGLGRIDEIDLLLSDVVMPTLSGPLLAERLLAVRPELPVILMSGYSDRLFAGGSTGAARAAFLQKPFMPEELLERIAQTLARA